MHLCEYSRFYDYLDSWPQQTAQMKATRVLWTEMEKGMNQIAENCSYLRSQFFKEHPTEKPVKAKVKDIERRSSFMGSESGSFGSLDLKNSDSFQRISEDEIQEAENAEVDDDDRSLEQVCINMMQADWLTSTEEGRKLLEVMTTSDDCLRLFESKTTQIFTNYLWKETRGYFIIRKSRNAKHENFFHCPHLGQM